MSPSGDMAAGGLRIDLRRQGAGFAAQISKGAGLEVERLVLGRPPEEVAQILPRLFNLCRAAQGAAVRLALGLAPGDVAGDLAREVLRDHMMKLFLVWPRHLGLPPRPFAPPGDEARAIFGPSGAMPEDAAAFWDWVARGEGVAPLVAAVAAAFAPGEAVADLPDVAEANFMTVGGLENSVAGRHGGHAVLAAIAATQGRGPLWRVVARLVDGAACLAGGLPAPRLLANGTAVCPAARGDYAVQADVAGGVVLALRRVTPTDHMLAQGGMLVQSFARLPGHKAGLAPLVLDILDPCLPVELRVQDA